MNPTITWTVQTLDVAPTEDGKTDVVIAAHWRCNGVEVDDGTEYTGSVYSSTAMGPIGPDFTPYLQLTQEQVLQWVWGQGVNKDATEAAVAQQIANAKNPPVIQPPLPWA